MKRTALFILGIALLLSSAASRVQRAAADDRLREEFHQSYPLSANGRVSLKNIAGDIRVTAWERNEVKVDAVKLAYTQERLAEAKIEVEASGDAVRIKTKYPEYRNMHFSSGRGNDDYKRESAATIEFTLTVPRNALCDINSVSGDIELQGTTGELKIASVSGDVRAKDLASQSANLSSVSGAVDATLERTVDGQTLNLSSVSGSVYLTLPSDANANVKANTVSGSVKNGFGLPVRVGSYVGRDFAGQIGNGGARVKLNTVSGLVDLRRAGDGKPLSSVTNLLSGGNDNRAAAISEARADLQEARREYEEALREAEKEQEEARREYEKARQRYDQSRNQGDEDARRDAERDFNEARREFEQVQREFRNAQRDLQRDLQRAEHEAQREAMRAQAEAIRESARASADAARAASDLAQGLSGEYYIGKNGPLITEKKEFSFDVNGAPNINMHTDDGGVIVRAWDNPQVKVVFVKRSYDQAGLNDFNIDAKQNGSTIEIRADVVKKKFDDKARGQKIKGDININGDKVSGWYYTGSVGLEVWVPRKVSRLKARTGDGRIMVEGVAGELNLDTGDGSVDVLRGDGRINVETGDGRISLNDCKGAAKAKTGDGRISLSGHFEELSAETGDGNITFAYPDGLNAVIEADCEDIITNGSSSQVDESRSAKRVTIGGGGKIFRFSTGDGKVYLQKQ